MIKVILFDCDGPIIKRDKYFTQRLVDLGYKLDLKKIYDFFGNEFLLCETGKADLKEELANRIKDWGWDKSLEELINFWFSGETDTDPKMFRFISELRKKGIRCFLTTDQEKYRAEYIWKTVGLQNSLEKIYSSCEVGFLKNQEEFWQELFLTLEGFSKNELLLIDDDQRVVDAAKEFGLNAEFYKNFEEFKTVMKEKYNL